jgi:nucleotide-binding universal stress UspA family protein
MSRTKATRARGAESRDSHPPFHILLATSGDETSLGAVRVAAALAHKRKAKVEVLTVATPFPHAAPTAFGAMPPAVIDQDSRRQALDRAKQQLFFVRGASTWPIVAEIGWTPDVIAAAAERWNASLIVLGLGEHHLLDRLFGSETAVKLAHHAPVPILAVPQDFVGLPSRAIAAIDFTPASMRAARAAADVLDSNGTLTLVHASSLVKLGSAEGSLTDVYTAGAQAKIEAERDSLRADTNCNIDAKLISDGATGALIELAERGECDLIALGAQEMGLVDRLLFGSVRSRVLRQVNIPVLIAPAAADEEEP